MSGLYGTQARPAVRASSDLRRVLSLPRRPPVELEGPRGEALVDVMTARLRRPDRPPGSPCGCAAMGRRCVDRLLPSQAWALWEAPLTNPDASGRPRGGLLAPIRVGGGKTMLDILMATVIPDCRVAVLLLPPGLVEQLVIEYLAVREHFVVPSLVLPPGRDESGWLVPGRPALHVVPYSQFSRGASSRKLESLRPDLVLADEVHQLKNRKAVRTGRVLRYFAEFPETRLCGWSGSICSKSILDFAHLLAFALGDGSPLPLEPGEVESWATAVDPSDWPAPAGALRDLVSIPGESVVVALGRRIRETRGVVSTGQNAKVVATPVLRERALPAMPRALLDLRKQLRDTWARPDGEELLTALDVERCARQLACGFYYRWRFPGNPERAAVDAWFDARKALGREMREMLKFPEPDLDSPGLLANAAERARVGYEGDLPVWPCEAWDRWRAVKDTVAHVTEAVWVDEYVAADAAAWGLENRGIVWYEDTAFGERVAKLSGLPLHRGGPGAERRILSEKGDRSIVASISSHTEGRNGLQFLFATEFFTVPMASGKEWEQALGRLNRLGQKEDEVVTWVNRHVPEFRESLDRALRLAKYVEGLMTASQLLLAADVEWADRRSLLVPAR